MGSLPENPTSATNSHLYPQALQLKLYQAFIFSIPILFSIILFLLFYLFYLKRRASSLSSSPPILPRTYHTQAAPATTYHVSYDCPVGLKGELKEKLQTILFDEEQREKDSQCCVCLGEFEMEEQLLQVMSCKHVFHVDCLHHWLYNNTTCPLCRCSVIPISTKVDSSPAPNVSDQQHHSIVISNHSPGTALQQHQFGNDANLNATASLEGSSSRSGAILRDSDRSSRFYANQDLRESIIVHMIHTRDSSS